MGRNWCFSVCLVLGCAASEDEEVAADTDSAVTATAPMDDADESAGSGGQDETAGNDDGQDDPDDPTAGSTAGPGGDTDDGDATTGEGEAPRDDLCFSEPPPGAPTPPPPPSYSGGACPAITPGYVTGFPSHGNNREFAFIVPSDYDESREYPVVFAWYHLSGDAMSFSNDIGVQALADRYDMIFIVPQATGQFQFVWPSTPLDNGSAGVDLGFFDDLYACVTEQYSVNTSCVSSLGVSAGGLWTSFLGQRRGQYLSANLVASGGYPTEYGGLWWPWQTSPHKFAALVLWGGPSDQLGLDFNAASLNYIQHLQGDSQFILECEHDGGHGLPPNIDKNDPASFDGLFHFILNNPYWTAENSPLLTEGLPEFYPDFCSL